MSKLLVRFVNDESGATAIEYGLIAAGISIAIIVVVNGLGTTLSTKFTSINTSLKEAATLTTLPNRRFRSLYPQRSKNLSL